MSNHKSQSGSSRSLLILFLGDPLLDRRVQNFLRYFTDYGWSVTLLFGVPSVTTKLNTDSLPCSVIQLPIRRRKGPLMFFDYNSSLGSALAKMGKFSVVLSSDLYSLNAARIFRERGGCRYLIYDAREVYTELPSVQSRAYAKGLWKFTERLGIRSADLVVVTAPDDAAALFKVHDAIPRTLLIRNLPMAKEASVAAPNLSRRALSIPENAYLFCYVGGLQKHRGLDRFIAALARLPDHAYFLILGGGEEQGTLQEQAQTLGITERVKFLGPVGAADVVPLLSIADAGVSLIEAASESYELALPSKLFEYMAAGLSILSSPLRQVTSLLAESSWCRFAEPLDQNALIREASFLMDIRPISDGKRLIEQELNFEHDVSQLLRLLTEKGFAG